MKKLILILLAFLAIFTYIRALEKDGVEDPKASVNSAEIKIELPLEIVR